MGFLGNLISATVRTVVLTPVNVVKDVVTLGGSIEGENETYTAQGLKKVKEDLEDACKDASNGDLI